MTDELERGLEESSHGLIEVISWLGKLRKTKRDLSQDNHFPGSDSKAMPSQTNLKTNLFGLRSFYIQDRIILKKMVPIFSTFPSFFNFDFSKKKNPVGNALSKQPKH
jgi:hypothetical protein